jgi:hypothetical protein
MIDFSLSNGRSSRYKHAARHLLDCSRLSSAIKAASSRTRPTKLDCVGTMEGRVRFGARLIEKPIVILWLRASAARRSPPAIAAGTRKTRPSKLWTCETLTRFRAAKQDLPDEGGGR